MTAFPRTILPVEVSELDIPGPLISKAQSGRVNIRSTQQIGRTWTEHYLLKVSNTVDRAFLATVRNFWRNGTIFDIGHVDYATPKGTGGGSPLINQPTQLVTDPENFGAWTLVGTPLRTSGQADPYGGTGAYRLEDDDGAVTEAVRLAVTFTGDGTKSAVAFIRRYTSTVCEFGIVDTVGFVWRHRLLATFNADGTLASAATAAGAGTIYTAVDMGGGWYAIPFTATGIVAADINNIYCYPVGVVAAATGGTYFFGINAWNTATPAGYIGPSHLQATGSTLYLDGATASVTNWLRAGDLVKVAGLTPAYEVTADTNSQAGGYVALPINPPLFTGGAPADNAVVTITGVTMSACLIAPPEFPTTSGTGADYGTLTCQFSETL
jgi:hypothetical protein